MEPVSLSSISHTHNSFRATKGSKSALPQDSGTVDTVSLRLPPPRLRPHPWRHPLRAVQHPSPLHLYLRLDCPRHLDLCRGLGTAGLPLSVLSWSYPSNAAVWLSPEPFPPELAGHSPAGIPAPSHHGTDYSLISRAVHMPYSRTPPTDQIWSSAAPHVPQSMSASRAGEGESRFSSCDPNTVRAHVVRSRSCSLQGSGSLQ